MQTVPSYKDPSPANECDGQVQTCHGIRDSHKLGGFTHICLRLNHGSSIPSTELPT